MARYNVGSLVRVSAVYEDDDGDAANPDVVKLSVRDPSGNLSTYTYGVDALVVRDSTGHFHADIDVDEDGIWYYRWWSTGDGQAADEDSFTVREAHAIA